MSMGELEIMPVFNMQKYVDGGHFKRHHLSSSRFTRHRVLVWMIYLNDVEKRRETFFPYINKRFKPKKGQMLIWYLLNLLIHMLVRKFKRTCDKYIMTGWIGLIPSCINEINFNKLPREGVTLHGR